MSRPKLLFVSPRFLFPLDEGGKIRTTGILRGLRGGAFEVTLASPMPPDGERFATDMATIADRSVTWPAPSRTLAARLRGVAAGLPVSVAGDMSAAGRRVVAAEIARGCDVLVADFPHSAVLLPRRPPHPCIMFTHNVEAEILERHAACAEGWRRLVWRREAYSMRRFEAAWLPRFDAVIAVSDRDALALAARYNLIHVPRIDTGVDLDFYRFQPPRPHAATVVFSGAMDSRSNIDGIEFLRRDVWPHMPASAHMCVIGRNPPADLVAKTKQANPTWQFTGTVDDIRPHLAAGDVAAIPLRVGSGTRLKAFEAMAMGLPVVSTTLGVEGLGLQPGRHYIAADTAPDFATALTALLGDYDKRQELAARGRALLVERFGWDRIAKQFEAICLHEVRRVRGEGKRPGAVPLDPPLSN
jgi:glycosyltransferase involved in cell wall biosynthesis